MALLVGNSLNQIEGLSSPSNNETSIYFTDKPLHLQVSIKPDDAHFNATVRSYGWVGWGETYGKFLRLSSDEALRLDYENLGKILDELYANFADTNSTSISTIGETISLRKKLIDTEA